MNQTEHNGDDEFVERLAEYDAAVAEGRSLPVEEGDDPDLERAKVCLDQLESLWPRRQRALDATLQSLETLLLEKPDTQFGRFKIVRELGRGGGGIVFLANDPRLKRQVALKVPRPQMLFTAALRRRFVREAEAAAQLDHRHIVPIYEAGEIGGICYLVSAYCSGPNLASWLRRRDQPVPARHAALIVAAVADGVAHVHRRGILHRDIKPSNVLLVSEEPVNGSELAFVPKLTDFGLAKWDASDAVAGAEGETATRTGAILGTPAYMAPEQAEGKIDRIGATTDVYALGVVLYELLAGKPPFGGDSDVATLQQVVGDEPRPLRKERRDVPRDLETICLKCMAKAPARRYSSATELVADLRHFLDGTPISARRVGRLELGIRFIRRRPLVTGMAAVTLGALFAIVALMLRERGDPVYEPPRPDPAARELIAKADALQWSARNVIYSKNMQNSTSLDAKGDFARMEEMLRHDLPEPGQRDVRSFEWHYLWRLTKRDVALRGHAGLVDRIAFSTDGRLCATASRTEIIVWDVTQGRNIREHRIATKHVNVLTFVADNTQLVAVLSQNDKTAAVVNVWDVATGKLLVEHSYPWIPSFTTVSRDGRHVAGVFDPPPRRKRAQLQIAEMGQSTRRTLLEAAAIDFHSPCLSPDGKLIALGYRPVSDARIQVHLLDVASGARIAKLEIEDDYVIAFCFSKDGKKLAMVTDLGHGTIWNWSANETVHFRDEDIWNVAFDPTGSVLALRSKAVPDRLRLRDAGTGNLVREVVTGFRIHAFSLSADGHSIGLGGDDNSLHLQQLNPAPADEKLPSPAPSGEAWAVAVSPKAPTLAVGYDNEEGNNTETLKLWDVKRKTARVLTGHQGTVMAVSYSPDGVLLATAGFDKKVGLWNAADGKHLAWLEGHVKPLRAVAFSPDGRLIASGGSDHAIALWNVVEKKQETSWIAHTRPIRALAFSPDGKQLASASNEESIAIWEIETRKQLFTLPDEHNVPCLAYSPDGTVLATGNERFAVKLWDPASGKLKQTLKGHTGNLRALAFSPNGQTLATGGEDKMVRLWNLTTYEELLALPTEHFVNGLAFDRTGKTLAAALHDGTVKIWSGD
jgi:WD40 repeat protein